MNFDLKRPCNNCPFLKEGGVRLTHKRAEQITNLMLSPSGGTFACHKTTSAGGAPEGTRLQHCAGALAFAMKNDNATQMMRIAGRLGWDPVPLEDCYEDIIDDPEEMVRGS